MGNGSSPDTIVAAEVELLEAEAWARMHAAFAQQTHTLPGLDVRRYGRASALVTPTMDVVAINRVIGLGFEQPLDAARLAEINAYYCSAGRTRWFLEWSPSAALQSPAVLEAAGGVVRGAMLKLFAHLAELPAVVLDGGPEVVEVPPSHTVIFRDMVGAGLGVPEPARPGIIAAIGQPGWRFYFAMEHGRPIAGAAMFTDGVGAWFGLSATAQESRGRGAQTALLARRIADARALGCRWISAETFPLTMHENGSLRNMHRAGLRTLYHRTLYRFETLLSLPPIR